MRNAKRIVLRLTFSLALCLALFARTVKAQTEESSVGGSPLEIKNAMGTILVSGLVGGILGLSTLSFYDRPEDNIRNIFFGAGGAMMIATIYMTMIVANSPLPDGGGAAKNMDFIIPYADPKGAGILMSYNF